MRKSDRDIWQRISIYRLEMKTGASENKGKIKLIKTTKYNKIFLILEIPEVISEVNPEVKSLTKELALIKHIKEATYNSLVIVKLKVLWKENIIKRITQINNCTQSCPIKFLSHILKIHLD